MNGKTITEMDLLTGSSEEERKELAQKEFAQEIRRLRAKAGLSQKNLGLLIGVEQTIMTRIEKGTHGITLDLVLRFARAFNDNPHRLANIYWGIESAEYLNSNKQVLDAIWDLIYPHYQPKVIADQEPPATEKQPTRQLRKYPHNKKALEAPDIEDRKVMEESPNPYTSPSDIAEEQEQN